MKVYLRQAPTAEEVYSMGSIATDGLLEHYIERAEAVLALPLGAAAQRSPLVETLLAAARLQVRILTRANLNI